MIAQRDKLYVPSMEQKIVFMCEMQGQISDGMWENLRPHDHWKKWSALRWDDVIVSHDLFGRTFDVPFSKYAFSDYRLLKIVGKRTILKIRLYQMYPKIVEPILKEDHWSIPEEIVYAGLSTEVTAYVTQQRRVLEERGLTRKMLQTALLQVTYEYSDLVEDCKILEDACRTRIIVAHN